MGIQNKVIVITGAGFLGIRLAKELLKYNPKEIKVLTRTQTSLERLDEFIDDKRIIGAQGDIKDINRLQRIFINADYVIHTAAEKKVNYCEKHPDDTYKINVEGTSNVCYAANDKKVKKVLFISTDKACESITYYGHTKAMGEQLVTAWNNEGGITKYSSVRYGNIFNSSSSVIQKWDELYKKKTTSKISLPLTNLEMTRFFMTIEEAIDLIINSLEKMKGGEVFVKDDMKAIKMIDLLEGRYPGCTPDIIGLRSQEKIHEKLTNTYCSKDHCVSYEELIRSFK